MKSAKSLINRNPPEETKQAYVESIEPALMKLRGRFDNCTFSKKKLIVHPSWKSSDKVKGEQNTTGSVKRSIYTFPVKLYFP